MVNDKLETEIVHAVEKSGKDFKKKDYSIKYNFRLISLN